MNEIRNVPIAQRVALRICSRLEKVASRLVWSFWNPTSRVCYAKIFSRVGVGGRVGEEPSLEVWRVEEVAAEDTGIAWWDVEGGVGVVEGVDGFVPFIFAGVVEFVLRSVVPVGYCHTGELVAV